MHGSVFRSGLDSQVLMNKCSSLKGSFSANAAPCGAPKRARSRVSFSSANGRGGARPIAESCADVYTAAVCSKNFDGNSAAPQHDRQAPEQPCKAGAASEEVAQAADAQHSCNDSNSEVCVKLTSSSGCSAVLDALSDAGSVQQSHAEGTSPLERQDTIRPDPVLSATVTVTASGDGRVEKTVDQTGSGPPVPRAVQQCLVGKRPRPQPEPLGESSEQHTLYHQLQSNGFQGAAAADEDLIAGANQAQAIYGHTVGSHRTAMGLGSRPGMRFTVAHREAMTNDDEEEHVRQMCQQQDACLDAPAADTAVLRQLYRGRVPMAAWHLDSFRDSGASAALQQLHTTGHATRAHIQPSQATELLHDPAAVEDDQSSEQVHAIPWRQGTSGPLESVVAGGSHHPVETAASQQSGYASDAGSQSHVIHAQEDLGTHLNTHENLLAVGGGWEERGGEYVDDECAYQEHHASAAPPMKEYVDDESAYQQHHASAPPMREARRVGSIRARSALQAGCTGPYARKIRQGVQQDLWRPPEWIRGLYVVSVIGLVVALIAAVALSTRAHHLIREFDTSNLRMPDAQFRPSEAYNNLQSATRMLMPKKVPASRGSRTLLHIDDDDLSTTVTGALLPAHPCSTPNSLDSV